MLNATSRHRRPPKTRYFRLLEAARADTVLRRLRSRGDVALVLNFHEVSPRHNPYRPAMSPTAFAELAEYLAATCHVTTLDRLREPSPPGRPRVVLSFDDGYYDFVEYVMPILERLGLPANQNVTVQSMVAGTPPWIVRASDALNAAPFETVRKLQVPGLALRLESDDDCGKAAYWRALSAHLKSVDPVDLSSSCPDLSALIESTEPSQFTRMMSVAEVKAASGRHEIGAHSYSHEPMARLSDSEFARDLGRCTNFFSELGLPLRTYAFPFGSHRPEQIGVLHAAGVGHVLLVGNRPAQVTDSALTRITMYGDSRAELKLRALGHPALAGIRSRLRGPVVRARRPAQPGRAR